MRRELKELLSAKKIFASMLRLLQSNDNFKIVKFLDMFLDLPEKYKKSLVDYIYAEVGNTNWEKWVRDKFMYDEFMKAVFFNYSGRQELDQATLVDLCKLIGEYLRSVEFSSVSKYDADIDIIDLLEGEKVGH